MLSIVGFAVGFANPAMFGLSAESTIMGGLYGASLFGNIWNATHQENNDTTSYSKFDALMNTVSSESAIPLIYGTRKYGGNQLWHYKSSDGLTLTKDVVISDGEIDGITEVKYNDILVSSLSGCSYAFHSGSPTQAPPSNYADVGGYKNIAWLRATMRSSSQLQGSNPTVTYVCKGKKVWDTRTNTYAHSSNPAMCLRDFLLSKRYGVAKFVPDIATMIDEDSFMEVADYCDKQIYFVTSNVVSKVGTIDDNIAAIQAKIDAGVIEDSDGIQSQITALQVSRQALINGQSSVDVNIVSFEPRYTLNIILDEKQNVTDALDSIFATFGGFLCFSGGKISLRCEKDDTVSYTFTNDTIVENSVTIEQLSLDETPNQYKIGYFDPANNWTQVKVISEDIVDQQPKPIGRGKVIVKEVTLAGCTSQAQAIALGRLYRLKNKLCSLTIEFKTTSFAMHLQPGDIITTTYDKFDDNGDPLRVLNAMPWRILEISQESGTYTIKARQYNASIYGGYQDTIVVKDYVPIIGALSTPPNVQDFAVSQNQRLIEFRWTLMANVTYELRQGSSWGSGTVIQSNITGNSYVLTTIVTGNYTYWIKAMTSYGVYSDTATEATIAVLSVPSSNIVVAAELLGDVGGTLTDCQMFQGKIIVNPLETWDDFAARYGTWKSEGIWGEPTKPTATYESQVYDLNKNLSSIVSAMWECSGGISIQWRYSEDGVDWTEYAPYFVGTYKFRYHQWKLTVITNGVYEYLSTANVVIDVPDVLQKFISVSITDAVNGLTLSFNPVYAVTPSITANVVDGQVAFVNIASKDETSVTLKAYNITGTSIAAVIDVQSLGY